MESSQNLKELLSRKRHLETKTEQWELFHLLFGLAVLLGVVGEVFAVDAIAIKMYAVYVAVGVTGEVFISVVQFVRGKRLRTVQKTVDDATEREAERHHAQLETHIAGLKSQLELANQRLGGRKLAREQIDFMITRLKSANCPFKASVHHATMSRDGSQFSNGFCEVFHKAGWKLLTELKFTCDLSFSLVFYLHPEECKIPFPQPFCLFVQAALACNAISDNVMVLPNIEIPKGVVGVYVGMAP